MTEPVIEKKPTVINDVNSPYKNVNSIAWHAMFGVGLISGTRVIKLYTLNA